MEDQDLPIQYAEPELMTHERLWPWLVWFCIVAFCLFAVLAMSAGWLVLNI